MKYAHIGEVVATLGLSKSFWRRMGDQGKVRCVRVNRRRVFDLDDCARICRDGVPEDKPDWDAKAFQARTRELSRELSRDLRAKWAAKDAKRAAT